MSDVEPPFCVEIDLNVGIADDFESVFFDAVLLVGEESSISVIESACTGGVFEGIGGTAIVIILICQSSTKILLCLRSRDTE